MIFMNLRRPVAMRRHARGNRYHREVNSPTSPLLYADAPLRATHHWPVDGGHGLFVQEFGDADGIPAVVLHGGPGSGSSPLQRRFFDPQRYRILCMDQRGSGNSQPRGSTEHNTTAHLLADLRLMRERLGVERWLVVGGSWGATLAVAHAADAPDAVHGLLLRASFLARPEDIHGFFQDPAGAQPAAWARLAAAAAPGQRDHLLDWLAASLADGDGVAQQRAALAWWAWECALAAPGAANGHARSEDAPSGDALAALIDRYRVQSHYLRHGCWLAAPTLLDRCEAVPRVPTLLLHSRDDRICPLDGARALQARLPGSRLQEVDGAGHNPAHPAMAAAMVTALDHYAAHGDFGAAP
jgi:proline iminopeptidase